MTEAVQFIGSFVNSERYDNDDFSFEAGEEYLIRNVDKKHTV